MVNAAEHLIGHFGWILVVAFMALMFRGLLKQFVAGLAWKLGRRYNETDVVVVDGYPGRITRIGLLFTEIYIYDTVKKPPNQGWSWMIANDKLIDLMIWKPLSKHEGQYNVLRITGKG